jgi:hypothetical protein
MTRKKENYDLWLKEIRERHRIRNAKRKAKRKAKKEAIRTWKQGCLITFKTLDACREPITYICRMKKVPNGVVAHSCGICRIINGRVPCLKIMTNTYAKCMIKRPLNTFPLIIGKVGKHGKYHIRNISL